MKRTVKRATAILFIGLVLVLGVSPGAHARVFVEGYFGPYYYPYGYYPYSYPYAPYPYTYTEPQVTYSAPQQSYWYYCKDAQAYYPYVQSCPGGWEKVVPTPPQR